MTAAPSDFLPLVLVGVGEDGSQVVRFPGEITRIGWNPPANLTRPEYMVMGDALAELDQALPWVWGDFILHGEQQWGEMYAQAMPASGRSYERLAHYVRVCRRFEFCRRRQKLTFAHHEQVVANKYSDDSQDYWLGQAEAHDWSAAELGRQIKRWHDEQERLKAEQRLQADGDLVDVEPEAPPVSEVQFDWLPSDNGPSADVIDPPAFTGGWVECPNCHERFCAPGKTPSALRWEQLGKAEVEQ
jgi:hypothetical protein